MKDNRIKKEKKKREIDNLSEKLDDLCLKIREQIGLKPNYSDEEKIDIFLNSKISLFLRNDHKSYKVGYVDIRDKIVPLIEEKLSCEFNEEIIKDIYLDLYNDKKDVAFEEIEERFTELFLKKKKEYEEIKKIGEQYKSYEVIHEGGLYIRDEKKIKSPIFKDKEGCEDGIIKYGDKFLSDKEEEYTYKDEDRDYITIKRLHIVDKLGKHNGWTSKTNANEDVLCVESELALNASFVYEYENSREITDIDLDEFLYYLCPELGIGEIDHEILTKAFYEICDDKRTINTSIIKKMIHTVIKTIEKDKREKLLIENQRRKDKLNDLVETYAAPAVLIFLVFLRNKTNLLGKRSKNMYNAKTIDIDPLLNSGVHKKVAGSIMKNISNKFFKENPNNFLNKAVNELGDQIVKDDNNEITKSNIGNVVVKCFMKSVGIDQDQFAEMAKQAQAQNMRQTENVYREKNAKQSDNNHEQQTGEGVIKVNEKSEEKDLNNLVNIFLDEQNKKNNENISMEINEK